MAQLAIVKRTGAYFREYQIAPGDHLAGICLRFGHRNWRTVYEHAENAAFRARFPNPDQIDYVNSVNLFVPLAGGTVLGRSRRGVRIGDYFLVRVRDETGGTLAAAKLNLKLVEPGQPHVGRAVTPNADGDLIIINPTGGSYLLASATYELVPAATKNQSYPVDDISAVLKAPGSGLPDPTYDFALYVNTRQDVVARPVFYTVCPFCGATFKTVKPAIGGTANVCPNDGADITHLEHLIETQPASFLSPVVGQNPSTTPNALVCRGSASLATAHDTVTVFWDESRFAVANGADYRLADPYTHRTVDIIGRATWGAGPIVTSLTPSGQSRNYEFHGAAIGGSAVYTSAVPSNETTPLKDVLSWMTIHHTTDAAQNAYATVTSLQQKHQTSTTPPRPSADIGYQYVIDANGSIYEGRPLGIEGSHVGLFNAGNIGIVMAGDFEPRVVNLFTPAVATTAAIASLDSLVEILGERFGIRSVWTHVNRNQQVSGPVTECPGTNMIPHVNAVLRPRFPGPPP